MPFDDFFKIEAVLFMYVVFDKSAHPSFVFRGGGQENGETSSPHVLQKSVRYFAYLLQENHIRRPAVDPGIEARCFKSTPLMIMGPKMVSVPR
jgi:hypothetical protein